NDRHGRCPKANAQSTTLVIGRCLARSLRRRNGSRKLSDGLDAALSPAWTCRVERGNGHGHDLSAVPVSRRIFDGLFFRRTEREGGGAQQIGRACGRAEPAPSGLRTFPECNPRIPMAYAACLWGVAADRFVLSGWRLRGVGHE